MCERLFEMRKTLRDLFLMVEAMMPEAERLLNKGEEAEFLRVTAMLKKATALESMIEDAIVVETGDPSFGTGLEHTSWGRHE